MVLWRFTRDEGQLMGVVCGRDHIVVTIVGGVSFI